MKSTSISRSYRFESAHFLPKVPKEHQCSKMHGHNYRVDIIVRGEVDARGFVADFFEIDAAVRPVLKTVDHKVLNEVPGLENPTAEVIAFWFLERIHMSSSVRVYENDDCWAQIDR